MAVLTAHRIFEATNNCPLVLSEKRKRSKRTGGFCEFYLLCLVHYPTAILPIFVIKASPNDNFIMTAMIAFTGILAHFEKLR